MSDMGCRYVYTRARCWSLGRWQPPAGVKTPAATAGPPALSHAPSVLPIQAHEARRQDRQAGTPAALLCSSKLSRSLAHHHPTYRDASMLPARRRC